MLEINKEKKRWGSDSMWGCRHRGRKTADKMDTYRGSAALAFNPQHAASYTGDQLLPSAWLMIPGEQDMTASITAMLFSLLHRYVHSHPCRSSTMTSLEVQCTKPFRACDNILAPFGQKEEQLTQTEQPVCIMSGIIQWLEPVCAYLSAGIRVVNCVNDDSALALLSSCFYFAVYIFFFYKWTTSAYL